MKDRPILFSAPMVRAILAGTKTQTRRVLNLVARGSVNWFDTEEGPPIISFSEAGYSGSGWYAHSQEYPEEGSLFLGQPFGVPGDRLWVRETWGAVSPDEFARPLRNCRIEYRADLPDGCSDQPGQWPADEARGDPEAPKWKPSIHMPRWASRITLEVTGVKVERLQDITAGDCEAEGIEQKPGLPRDTMAWALWNIEGFHELWDSINGKRAPWKSNPWVWCVSFRRIDTKQEAA